MKNSNSTMNSDLYTTTNAIPSASSTKKEEIRNEYQSAIQQSEKELRKVRKNIYYISLLRLVLFVGALTNAFLFWDEGWLKISLLAILPFLVFIWLVKRHNKWFHQKAVLKKRIEINEQEIKALQYDFSGFEDGEEFMNPEHPYTYDLDVFGKQSLFQSINRTSTPIGKEHLAAWFNKHLDNKLQVEERQEGIRELANDWAFRQEIRLRGMLFDGKAADKTEIEEWAKSPCKFRQRKGLRVLPYLAVATNATCIGLAIADILPSNIAVGVFFCFVLFSTLFSKGITQLQMTYGKKLQILSTYADLILLTEQREMKSAVLQKLKEQLKCDGENASQAVHELAKRMNMLDQRNNILISTILNGLLLWELAQVMHIEAWKVKHAHKLNQWIEIIGEVEAYCSLATFTYNHPEYTYPTISPLPFELRATALGHPLMPAEKCVRNNICIERKPFFIIITGANMAGKSTYLRTIGVNYLLACLGAPVWADEMVIHPSQLITSLRTSDSLKDNESYFFAELKRLKRIIDRLRKGEELFIILDEILKGTNSMDKQKGSLALVKQFIQMKANGIIATHDLLLGSLIDVFPNQIHNFCFEADITDNELTFSYQMKEGVAQNMNACFLMKKMGIVGIDENNSLCC